VSAPRPEPWRIDKRRARRAFERAAATYDGAAFLQREVGQRLYERLDLLRGFRPVRILDAGCGTGALTAQLARRWRGARVVALDIAPAMLARARRRGPWLRRPWCVAGDIEALPLAAGSFDLVFSSLALQWCPDLERAIGELARVLAPGGLLLFATFGPDTLRELRAAWAEADGGAHVHVHGFPDLHEVGDLLLHTGLADPVTDAEWITVRYGDVLELMRDLKAIGARNAAAGRPRGLTGRGRIEALRRAYGRCRDAGGRLPATFEVVYGHAWKPAGGGAVRVAPPSARRRGGGP